MKESNAPDPALKVEISQYGIKANAIYDPSLQPSARMVVDSFVRLLAGYYPEEQIDNALRAIVNKKQKAQINEIK